VHGVKRAVWLGVFAAACAPVVIGWASAGCDNSLIRRPQSDEGGGGQAPDEEGGGGFGPLTGVGVLASSGAGLDAYVEPPCTDKPPPIEDYACDPYDQESGDCGFGEGCYIFVEYPSEPCGQEIFGAICLPEGIGGQGDPCGGPLDCQADFVCVVADSGTQCVQYCPLEGASNCPDGLVCEPIDVEGFGGCI
jgi:hypothetical protein